MIKQLIEKYEKQLTYHRPGGEKQLITGFLKDLRELEVKEPAQLKTLVLCKRELFFQNSDSKRIHRVYPFTEREAKLLASMLGVEYMHV